MKPWGTPFRRALSGALSYQDVAERLGVLRTQVNRWARVGFPLRHLPAVAELLGMPLEDVRAEFEGSSRTRGHPGAYEVSRLIRDRGLTVAVVARRLGVSEAILRESIREGFHPGLIEPVAALLGVHPDTILLRGAPRD